VNKIIWTMTAHTDSPLAPVEIDQFLRTSATPRVVTIGGGHGQAVVLRALRYLQCSIGAVVATADDGGCSGELRRAYGMPAPGDARRCLSALAMDDELAAALEERIPGIGAPQRCRGNLVIAQKYLDQHSLQEAADWVAVRLGCVGRVMPASEEFGTLVVCDRTLGLVEGELNVERTVAAPLVATVTGADRPNITALRAIVEADVLIMGPGSFYTSTISALVTGEVGAAVCRSSARRLLILNLGEQERLCRGYRISDYTTILGSHLTICSRGESAEFMVLQHAALDSVGRLEDGSVIHEANVAEDDGVQHSAPRLARALGRILGISERSVPEVPVLCDAGSHRLELRQALAAADEFIECR
jgi:uncharacterized cofD-like protein